MKLRDMNPPRAITVGSKLLLAKIENQQLDKIIQKLESFFLIVCINCIFMELVMEVNVNFTSIVVPRPAVQDASEANPQATKADTAHPVPPTYKDPPPRFPYPDPDRGNNLDIQA